LPTGVSGLRVLDVSNPAEPRRSRLSRPAQSLFYNLKLQGATLFVTDLSERLAQSSTSRTRLNPGKLRLYDTPDFPHGLAVADGVAYIADRQSGLVMVDVADPARPQYLGRFGHRQRRAGGGSDRRSGAGG
jgi:hypothetical protein